MSRLYDHPFLKALEAVRELRALQINDLASEETAGEDRDHGDPDMSGQEVRAAVEHGVEPAVAGEPCEQALNHPANSLGNELPVRGSARRHRDMDVVHQRGRGEGL
jgi:hypothetical protein